MNGSMCEEEHKLCLSKTRQLLSEAQGLMNDIEEILSWFSKTSSFRPRWNEMDHQVNIEEDGDTWVIDGFRFESAATKEELKRLGSTADEE